MDRLAHILNRKVNIVCDHFKADQEAVTTKSYRGAKEVLSKYVSIYFVYQHYDNLRQIDVASIFNFDRSSVVYALKKIEDYKNYDKQIAKDIEVINKKIKSMYLKQRR